MPIFEKGYRRWDGEMRGRVFRWLTIAKQGIRLSWKGKWVRRFALVAWLPLLYYGLIFFAVGQMTDVSNLEKAREYWQFRMMEDMFGGPLAEKFAEDPASFRPLIWSLLVHFFMHYTQIFCVMIIVAIVGPKLVSEDMKSRALSLYFSKPLGRIDYLFGKFAVVAFWVGAVTLLPSRVLYAVSILFSPGLETLVQTLGIVPKVFLYSLFLMTGCGTIMLALSSLSPNARLLGFVWAGFWVMSSVASRILSLTFFPPFGREGPVTEGNWTGLVSFSANFDAVGVRLFEIERLLGPVAAVSDRADALLKNLSYGHAWGWSLLIIGALTALSAVVVFRRVGRPGEAGT